MMSFGDNSYEEGLLESKILYKEESGRFVELQRERYLYDIQKYSGDVYVQRCVSLENVVKNLTDQRMKASDKYYCGTYRLVSAKVFPVKTLTITYSGTDTLTYTETRTFANDIYLNLTSSRRYIDSSTPSATEYSYCYDATDAVSRKMKERNMLSMPLSVKTTYKGTEILVATKYGFFINGNDTLIEPASVTMTRTGEHDTYTYNSYDGFGNPLHITRNGLEHRYYLWSYHGHCPIAEIIGGDYTPEEVRSAVRAVFGKNAEDISMQELPDTVKLMNGSLQRKLPKAQVSTFTFDSYSGVTSVTAPNGITAKYLYDGFGRLERSLIPVLLSNGCISEVVRESYQYHYGNK